MRGTVPGLGTPYPLGSLMPAVYQEDPFAMQWLAGLDDVLAPAISSLDCLEAYIDPRLAPMDFLEWLASWVGIIVDRNWPIDRVRIAVSRAVALYRTRGTPDGLRDYVEVLTGGRVEVLDNGGASWSSAPGAELPGEDTPRLAIRVTLDNPDGVSIPALNELVIAAKPAHVVHRLEVVGS
ncbi:phage tail protein [Streptacidiphilus rugosus]|uniref:phage tail protein n=1 Tax=Streptacidiphilus rugosus TaxID=405783 RepID=UPI0005691CEE|nr:phage tail protein [Streptacidiphilus rugosus]